MAAIRKLASGKWQAQIARQGVRKSKTFRTKLEARDWAAREEHLILTGSEAAAHKRSLADVLDRYARDVSSAKRGARKEILRIEKMRRDGVAATRLADLSPDTLARWRDKRLEEVSAASVKREMAILSHALTVARKEWRWLSANPMRDVRKPPSPPPRDRRIGQGEIDRILLAAGNGRSGVSERVGQAFLFALETAMRAGEICGLTWGEVDLERRVAHLSKTKNGTSRDVPLSRRAVELLDTLPRKDGPCFGLTPGQLVSTFWRIKAKSGVSDLHFHDTRHEAITRLAKKLDVLPLARMVGHRDIRMLQVYYNETAEELALRLE